MSLAEISPSAALRSVAGGLPADVLAHLAAVAREVQRPKVADPAVCAEELAAILERGSVPTVGFWQRHLIRSESEAGR